MKVITFMGSQANVGTTTSVILTAADLSIRKNKRCLVVQPAPCSDVLLEYLTPLTPELSRVYRESSLSSIYRAMKAGSLRSIHDLRRKIISFYPNDALGVVLQDKTESDSDFEQDTKNLFKRFLQLAQKDYDYLICDLGSSFGAVAQVVLSFSDKIIVAVPQSHLRTTQYFRSTRAFTLASYEDKIHYLITRYKGTWGKATLFAEIHKQTPMTLKNTSYLPESIEIERQCDRSYLLSHMLQVEIKNTTWLGKVLTLLLSFLNFGSKTKPVLIALHSFVDSILQGLEGDIV